MSQMVHTSARLFVLNEKRTVLDASDGGLALGVKLGDRIPLPEHGVLMFNGKAYRASADELPDQGSVLFLAPLEAQQNLHAALTAIAECSLKDLPSLDGKLGTALLRATSTLNEAIRQSLNSSKSLEISSESLAESAERLSDRANSVASQLEQTLTTSKQLETAIESNLNATRALERIVGDINSSMSQGRSALDEATDQMEKISSRVDQTRDIVSAINEIAFKTNILALNAAVEAARAGESGRGFAIVAQEVRALAGHSAEQAGKIGGLLNRTVESSQKGQEVMQRVDETLSLVFSKIDEIGQSVRSIRDASDRQVNAMKETSVALHDIASLNEENATASDDLAGLSALIKRQTGFMRDTMEVFDLNTGFSHPTHLRAAELVKNTAHAISLRFEQAISNGEISQADLFNFNYTPVADTNPQRFNTSFDAFCDAVLPEIQEPALESQDFPIYLIAIDKEGYVPTHNERFCQPLTGDPQKDLVGNRTKRIFTDRVGQTAGAHQEDYLILTYRRDTGEVLTDISAPIYIFNRHWGGVRCGYRI